MRGRQQVYLTIGCAPNWHGLALDPRRDMPIFRGRTGLQERAGWDCVRRPGGPRGMSMWREWAVRGMPILGGKEWAIWGYVQPSSGPRGMSRGGAAGRGGEAQLGEAGKFRYSSICF